MPRFGRLELHDDWAQYDRSIRHLGLLFSFGGLGFLSCDFFIGLGLLSYCLDRCLVEGIWESTV